MDVTHSAPDTAGILMEMRRLRIVVRVTVEPDAEPYTGD
jgi:hypothetical protein